MQSFSGCHLFQGILDLFKEGIDGVVCVIGIMKFGIVVLQARWKNLGVRGVQAIKKFARGSFPVSGLAMPYWLYVYHRLTPREFWRRGLSVALYSLKLVVELLKTYRMLAIWKPVSPSGNISSLLGLMGTKNGVSEIYHRLRERR